MDFLLTYLPLLVHVVIECPSAVLGVITQTGLWLSYSTKQEGSASQAPQQSSWLNDCKNVIVFKQSLTERLWAKCHCSSKTRGGRVINIQSSCARLLGNNSNKIVALCLVNNITYQMILFIDGFFLTTEISDMDNRHYVIDATKVPLNYARPLTKELDSRSLKMWPLCVL